MLDKFFKKFVLIKILIILTTTNANAYIDPGTGTFIIQSLLAIGGTIIFYLGYPLRIVKNIFNKIFQKKINKKDSKN